MIAMTERDRESLKDHAIQQALHARDMCRAHLKSIENLAVAHAETAIHRLAAIEFGRLEKQWRKDPYNYRIPFAASYLGSAQMVKIWAMMVSILKDVTRMPSFDLVLECIRSEGSPVEVQSITESGRKIAYHFLRMQKSPGHAIKTWLKLSKCVDTDHYQRILQSVVERNPDPNLSRREMLIHAMSKLRAWQEVACHAQTQYEEYCNSYKKSTIPACLVDRTLAASLRDAESRLNRAERHYQAVLKQHGREDLSALLDLSPETQPTDNPESPAPISDQQTAHVASPISAQNEPEESSEHAPELLHVMATDATQNPASGNDNPDHPADKDHKEPLSIGDNHNATSVSSKPGLAINIIDSTVAEYGHLAPLTELDLKSLKRCRQQRTENRRNRRNSQRKIE